MAMWANPLFATGHHQGIHWHPNGGHMWTGRWTFGAGTFYVRDCPCGAYERWGNGSQG
jgi:hypothetical protein